MLRGLAAGLAHAQTGVSGLPIHLVSCDLTAQTDVCSLLLQLADRHTNSAHLPELLQLLGLQVADPAQLLTDIAKTTALTLGLFSGPLYHSATTRARQQTKQAAAGAAWQGAGSSTPLLHQLRDIVVSPIAEEWCFRACMLPLLWMQVGSVWAVSCSSCVRQTTPTGCAAVV
jgi:hypothetical protein